MTIETQTSKVRYQGNGFTTVWPVPFPVVSDEHLHLIVTDTNEISEQIHSGYQVTGLSAENVSVEYPLDGSPLPSGKKLIIYRKMPLIQPLDLERGGSFDAEVIERQGFDHVVMQIQQLDEHAKRSLQVPITSDQTPEELLTDIFTAHAQGVQSASNADTSATTATTQAGLSQDSAEASASSAEASANSATQSETSSRDALDHASISESWADKANLWAENPIDLPVEYDEQDNPLYSAKHWAHEAAELQITPATTEHRGGIRVGNGLYITENDKINVNIAATTERGIARIATAEEIVSGITGADDPAFLTLEQVMQLLSAIKPLWPIGWMEMLPFRNSELPDGWYFMNGDRYTVSSPQGIVLLGIPSNYKSDWGITVSGDTINVPKFFYVDGRGYFIRVVNGTNRQVGSHEEDMFQTHMHYIGNPYFNDAEGILFVGGTNGTGWHILNNKTIDPNGLRVTAPRSGRFGSETRSLNIGMTPAIYLGV